MSFNAVAVAQSFAEEFSRRAPEMESVRRLPADLAGKLADAGLFRMVLPAALGGHGTPPAQIAQALEILAQADASAAWCVMIGATMGAMANRLPAGAAREVFGEPDVISAGVFAPMGRAVEDGDHWIVNGRWQWGSGSQNAAWIAGGAVLMGPDGPLTDDHGQPQHRMMIFPADQVELIDTWRTAGLCGTGSLDFAVRDVRVPKARSVALHADPVTVDTPLACFPVFGLLAMGVAGVALGNARGALLAAGTAAQTRKAAGSQRAAAERNVVQADFARAVAKLSAARAHYFETIGVLWAAVQSGEAGTEPRNRLRLACAHAAETAADVSKVAYDMMGGSAVYLDNDLQRRFRDANVITHHAMVAPAMYELTGRILLGLPTRTDQL